MEQEFEEIDLLELILVVWKKKWLIAIAVIIGGILGFVATQYAITPQYEAKTTLMVNGAGGSDLSDLAANFDLSAINASQKMVVTYSEIVQSRIVLEQVIDKLDLEENYNQLVKLVTAVPVKNTEILNITVTYPDPEDGAEIANKIADVFIKEVIRIVKANNVEIIDEAIAINRPVNVHTTRNIAVGIVLGGMVAVFGILVIYLMDQTIKNSEDVEKYLDLPVLGSIVDFSEDKKGGK